MQLFFLISSMVLRSSQSTADLVTVVSARIAVALNRSRATQAVCIQDFRQTFSVIDGFDWIWMKVFTRIYC